MNVKRDFLLQFYQPLFTRFASCDRNDARVATAIVFRHHLCTPELLTLFACTYLSIRIMNKTKMICFVRNMTSSLQFAPFIYNRNTIYIWLANHLDFARVQQGIVLKLLDFAKLKDSYNFLCVKKTQTFKQDT